MNSENIILIPARAGASNISRQNLRLVNDKPLIYYVIKSALKFTKNVYVSTDSDEIKQVSILYGAKIIQRSKHLTKNNTKLEEIAFDALSKLERKNFQKCLILNPKYPLITLSTIKKFFSLLNKNIQTIYGYEIIPHHQYKQINFISKDFGSIVKDLNNCIITEKIVSFNCKLFLKSKNFQSPIFGLKLTQNEPLVLDSYHDFAILEKILSRKRILVRVDGGDSIGLGHVHNMLTILNHFRNEEILIVMDAKNKQGYNKFQEHLYKVKFFKNESELFKLIRNFEPNLIFNDILNTSINYMKKIKHEKSFVVNFEDIGNGRKLADLVFNPIYHSDQNILNEYYGPKFACVRDEFRIWDSSQFKKIAKNVVLIFGGLDTTNKTYLILKLIEKYKLKNINYSIIIGQGFKERIKLLKLIQKMRKNDFKIELKENVEFLAKIFQKSDFAITSNGRTVFELGSLHVPMITIPVNKRENKHTFVQKYDVGYVVELENESKTHDFLNAFNNMLQNKNREKFQKKLREINLLHGVDRVVQKINNDFEITNKKINKVYRF
jgi:spore coat polysaccharide biosynthesis predicted glycosyltransferase SpsG/CMP-N-acetylneuraminic acid synthetase